MPFLELSWLSTHSVQQQPVFCTKCKGGMTKCSIVIYKGVMAKNKAKITFYKIIKVVLPLDKRASGRTDSCENTTFPETGAHGDNASRQAATFTWICSTESCLFYSTTCATQCPLIWRKEWCWVSLDDLRVLFFTDEHWKLLFDKYMYTVQFPIIIKWFLYLQTHWKSAKNGKY